MPNPVSAKTHALADWDLVWVLVVCCPSHPFPLLHVPENKKAPHGLISHFCPFVTFMPVFSLCLCSGCHCMLHMQIMEENWSLFRFPAMWAVAPHEVLPRKKKYNGTPRQTPSNLYLSIIKDEVCHAEIAHPVTGFCCHSEGPGKVTVMTEITPVRVCGEARHVIWIVFHSFISSASRVEEGLCSCSVLVSLHVSVLCYTQTFYLLSYHSVFCPLSSLIPCLYSLHFSSCLLLPFSPAFSFPSDVFYTFSLCPFNIAVFQPFMLFHTFCSLTV